MNLLYFSLYLICNRAPSWFMNSLKNVRMLSQFNYNEFQIIIGDCRNYWKTLICKVIYKITWLVPLNPCYAWITVSIDCELIYLKNQMSSCFTLLNKRYVIQLIYDQWRSMDLLWSPGHLLVVKINFIFQIISYVCHWSDFISIINIKKISNYVINCEVSVCSFISKLIN